MRYPATTLAEIASRAKIRPAMFNPIFYILDDERKPKAVDIDAWVVWMMAHNQLPHVVQYGLVGGTLISTVFIGTSLAPFCDPPLVFETAIFREEEHVEIFGRYASWDEAEAGHLAATAHVRETLN